MYMRCTVEPLAKRLRCRVLGHRWEMITGTVGDPRAITTYYQCKHCHARRVEQIGQALPPVELEWLTWHARKVVP